MPARDELDLLSRCRPAIIDRAALIMDQAEEDRVLQRILDSDLAGSPARVGPGILAEDLTEVPGGVAPGSVWRLRHLSVAAAAVLAVVALIGVGLLARPGTRAATGRIPAVSLRWQLVSDVSGPWRTLATMTPKLDFHVSCAATSTCYALGSSVNGSESGELLVTRDGGQNWSVVDLPVRVAVNSAMSCADATTCAILGMEASGKTAFLETNDGGRSWSSQSGPAPLNSDGTHTPSMPTIASLACTSTSRCTAVGGPSGSLAASDAFTTTDGGATWSESALPVTLEAAGGLNTSSLQCLSDGTCMVAGFLPGSGGETLAAGYSTDGGATWQPASVPGGTYGIASMSCPTASGCLMVSFGGGQGTSTILRSADGGQTWSVVPASGLPQSQLTGISCPGSGNCWASGGTTQPSFPAGRTGSLLALSTDQGASWQPAVLPHGISAVEGVSCPSDDACYALAVLRSRPGDFRFVLLSNRAN